MVKEINSLLEKINMEGLKFLKDQADVLLYNQDIKKQNEKKKKSSLPATSSSGKIEGTGSKKSASLEVYIQQLKNPSYFNIRIGNTKLFMDIHEMKALYKIAKTAKSPREGGVRLYSWFKKERSDVLADGGITDSGNPYLAQIHKALMDTFTGS